MDAVELEAVPDEDDEDDEDEPDEDESDDDEDDEESDGAFESPDPDPPPSLDDSEPDDDLDPLADDRRSILAHPEPLYSTVGATNALRMVAAHCGQASGPVA